MRNREMRKLAMITIEGRIGTRGQGLWLKLRPRRRLSGRRKRRRRRSRRGARKLGKQGPLALLPPRALAETSLKPIKVLVISPSERLDDIASRHLKSLPLPIRAMLGGLGVSGQGDDARGAALASYLLFEAPYTRELIALGMHDTLARVPEVRAFFDWGETPAPAAAGVQTAALGR